MESEKISSLVCEELNKKLNGGNMDNVISPIIIEALNNIFENHSDLFGSSKGEIKFKKGIKEVSTEFENRVKITLDEWKSLEEPWVMWFDILEQVKQEYLADKFKKTPKSDVDAVYSVGKFNYKFNKMFNDKTININSLIQNLTTLRSDHSELIEKKAKITTDITSIEEKKSSYQQAMQILDKIECPINAISEDFIKKLDSDLVNLNKDLEEINNKIQTIGKLFALLNFDKIVPQCPICYDSDCQVALSCGHLFCKGCQEKSNKCAICNNRYNGTTQLFFP